MTLKVLFLSKKGARECGGEIMVLFFMCFRKCLDHVAFFFILVGIMTFIFLLEILPHVALKISKTYQEISHIIPPHPVDTFIVFWGVGGTFFEGDYKTNWLDVVVIFCSVCGNHKQPATGTRDYYNYFFHFSKKENGH